MDDVRRAFVQETVKAYLSRTFHHISDLRLDVCAQDKVYLEDIMDKARDQAIAIITELGFNSDSKDELGQDVVNGLQSVLMMAVLMQSDIFDNLLMKANVDY